MLHEVRHRAQRAPGARHAARVVQDQLAALRLEFLDDLAALGGRERLDPAPRHLAVGPAAVGERVVSQHQVEVVAEHGVGVHVDREARRDLPEALDEPGAAVGVVAVAVDPAEEGAAHAARHEVVVALVHGIDQQMPRDCHARMVRDPGARRYRRVAMAGVRNSGVGACEIGPAHRGTELRVSVVLVVGTELRVSVVLVVLMSRVPRLLTFVRSKQTKVWIHQRHGGPSIEV